MVRELSALGLAVGLFGAHDARAIPYFAGLGDLPGGEFQSQAYGLAVTESGPIVIGSSQTESGAEFFTWTPTTGLEPFPVGIARAISDDGSTVVGESGGPYRWTEADGTVYLGSLPDGTPTVLANDISADGNTVVGRAGSPSSEAFLWTAGTGAIGLGVPDTDTGDGASEAHAVSGDGGVVVGDQSQPDSTFSEAFRWTQATGRVPLGFLGGSAFLSSSATDVSLDGSAIVGQSGFEVFR